jgi:type II secretory pathway component PulF
MNYAYKAKTAEGQVTAGVIAADSPAQVRQRLRERGLFLLSVERGRAAAPAAARSAWRSRITRRDLMNLTSQLAIMTRSGIDLAGALESVARKSPKLSVRRTLEGVRGDIAAGKSVTAALKARCEVFGSAYVASVAAGEAAGRLPEVLARLAQVLRGELRLAAALRALLAYPVLLAGVSALVMAALVLFVLPQFADVFRQLEMPLPALTRALLAVSGALRSQLWLWGGLLAALLAGGVFFARSEAGRQAWDHAVLHLPVLRSVTRPIHAGRVCRMLGMLLESGVPLLESLRLARASVQNRLYRTLFDQLEHEVLNGRDLSPLLAAAPFIPDSAAEMISTAERTGTLASVTQVLGEFYEEEGETRLRDLAAVLEPAIIIVMGLLVACVVLSVMLPMFDFSAASQGGA